MSTPQTPKGYAEACDRLAKIVIAASQGEQKPLFAFAPREAFMIVALEDIKDHVARNEQARRVLALALECDPVASPTMMMLRAVVEMLELPFETVTVEEIVSWVPGATPVMIR